MIKFVHMISIVSLFMAIEKFIMSSITVPKENAMNEAVKGVFE